MELVVTAVETSNGVSSGCSDNLMKTSELENKVLLQLSLSNLESQNDGVESLHFLYAVFKLNMEWTENRWNISLLPHLSSSAKPEINFSLPDRVRKHAGYTSFNPLNSFKQIGNHPFNHCLLKETKFE
eukprot:m.138220 g.138220  ORF g.138220 m.138220 type:complete len:128 (+) comp38245_c0_seq2:20-403(+)